MKLLAIDPGTTKSAWVYMEWDRIIDHAIEDNADVMRQIRNVGSFCGTHLVIEQIASFGMPVGKEVFETVFWSGRFAQLWEHCGGSWSRMPRKEVCMHICGSARAKDQNIRQALIDRYGGKETAIGKKRNPGPLYGIKADEWQALGLAITFLELDKEAA